MSQYIVSVIRTWVPIIVGAFISWLATLNITVDGEAQAALVLLITVLIQGLYYAALRWLEQRYPQIGALLGYIRQPIYVDPNLTPAQQTGTIRAAVRVVAKTDTHLGNG